jgi:hypothetical protein
MRYRKKLVVIEAHRWWRNGDHPQDAVGETLYDPMADKNYERLEGAVVRFYRHPDIPGTQECSKCGRLMHEHGWIDTLEDGHNVCPGDWIIRGVKGEMYPVKPDIFAATYEPVGGES